ncbi:alpha/beta fold hydrolase [Nocardia sp. CA-290969]|uniref:alpha/beta fold hydrolase n=1 Tax=Nocardia sp. CA-290969 TaxID=3239986 RepID=UPI003D92247D
MNTGRAQTRHEREDVGGFENPAQGTDRRADSAGKSYGLGVVEQIEGRNVTTRLDEQVARPGPLPLRGPVKLGAGSVGPALHRQLSTVADDLTGHVIPDCGHIIPLDRPEALLVQMLPFLRSRTDALERR